MDKSSKQFLDNNIIFLLSYVSIATAIIIIRQVSIKMGNNPVVISSVIAFFLLSFGYGIKACLKFSLTTLLLVCATALSVGLSANFIKLFYAFWQQTFMLPIFYVFYIYLILIIAPIVYFQGNSFAVFYEKYNSKDTKPIRPIVIGGFCGALVTSMLSLHFLGVVSTIGLNSIMLAAVGLFIATNIYHRLAALITIVFLVLIVINFKYNNGNKILTFSNVFSDYSVAQNYLKDEPQGQVLFVNDVANSLVADIDGAGFSYIEKIKDILFRELKLKDKEILVLGAGGFSLSSEDTFTNKFTYIDIDKDIVKFVNKNITQTINGELIISDARVYVRDVGKKFDVIVMDVFQGIVIPYHLLTQEFYKEVYKKLNSNGYVVLNIIASPKMQDSYSQRIDNTIRSIFTHCMVMPLSFQQTYANILYICSKGKLDYDNAIYTDNQATSNIDQLLCLY